MKTNGTLKLTIAFLVIWNLVLTYLYFDQSQSIKILKRTVYNHFEPELEDSEKSHSLREAEATREQLYK